MTSASQTLPAISRVFPDGTLVELLYREETTSFAIAAPDGTVRIEPDFPSPGGDRLVPYSAGNSLLATGCVQFPSDHVPFTDKAALLADLRAFIHRYVDLAPLAEAIAAHYVLLSWVHDAFNEVPYLRFQGRFGSGKTRALLVVGSLCYKPFFASGASTVSPIFHILDTIGGTLVLDEADLRFSDATADLTKILNNGTTKGMPVLRTMTNKDRELNPRAFRVFGPKLLAMRGGFDDDALESRLITVETGKGQLRRDIPLSLPDAMAAEALDLRNRLLGWRFALWRDLAIDPDLAQPRLSARGNQMALPLLALVDDPELRAAIGDMLHQAEATAAADRDVAPEVQMLAVLADMVRTATSAALPLAAVAESYNEKRIGSSAPPLNAKTAGILVRGKLKLRTAKSNGVYVIPSDQWDRILRLGARHGLIADETEAAGGADYAPGA